MPTSVVDLEIADDARESSVGVVRDALQSYAGRGVFRSFSEAGGRGGKTDFRFLWLREEPFDLLFDPRQGSIRFKDLLPGIPAGSEMYKDFKGFLKRQCSEEVPEHRRIDSRRASVKAYNRGGNVSVTLQVKGEDYAYGVNRAVNLVHEIFMVFLKDGPYYEYMIDHLGLDVDEE